MPFCWNAINQLINQADFNKNTVLFYTKLSNKKLQKKIFIFSDVLRLFILHAKKNNVINNSLVWIFARSLSFLIFAL